MAAPSFLDELPASFAIRRGAKGLSAVRAEVASRLEAAGFGPDADGALDESPLAGRRPLAAIAGTQGAFLLRRFSHGGLLRWLTGARFADPARPFRELALSERLRHAGLATPEVLAARARRAALFGWELALVTRRVAGARDLGALLGAYRRGELEHARLRAALRACGRAVSALHAAGFLHADLNPNNLLVDERAEGEPAVWTIDLDRSRFVESLDEARRRDNLRRLYRHVARREERHGRALARTDFARFLRSYDASRWKADWRAIAVEHARRGIWHRLGWWIEERASRRDDARHEPQSSGSLGGPVGSSRSSRTRG